MFSKVQIIKMCSKRMKTNSPVTSVRSLVLQMLNIIYINLTTDNKMGEGILLTVKEICSIQFGCCKECNCFIYLIVWGCVLTCMMAEGPPSTT